MDARHDGHRHGHDHHHDHHHDHGHDHDHGTGGHAHAVTSESERRVFLVLLLTGGFMVVEVVAGLMTGSLALLADAGHMLTDFGALALAWFAFRVARRPADPRRSYGWHRVEVLAAFVNGLALFAVAIGIVIAGFERLADPVAVLGGPMLVVAALGLLVNLAALVILHRGPRENLNLRGASLHVMGDLLGSVAAMAAAGVILATGWTPVDPILSVLVALLVLRSAWRIVRSSGHILLEGTPEGMESDRIGAAVASLPGVTDVHHVHAWSLTGGRHVLTLHAVVDDGIDQNAVLAAIGALLEERFGIDHSTIQLERGGCATPQAGASRGPRG